MNATISPKTPRASSLRGFVRRLRCRFNGHNWKVGRYEDESSYAVCECCGERREPVPRTDGCTPVWDAPSNAFKCQHSSNYVAKSWGGLCPAHRAANTRTERRGTATLENQKPYEQTQDAQPRSLQ